MFENFLRYIVAAFVDNFCEALNTAISAFIRRIEYSLVSEQLQNFIECDTLTQIKFDDLQDLHLSLMQLCLAHWNRGHTVPADLDPVLADDASHKVCARTHVRVRDVVLAREEQACHRHQTQLRICQVQVRSHLVALVQKHDCVQSRPERQFKPIADVINQPVYELFPALQERLRVTLFFTAGVDGVQLLRCQRLSHLKGQ